MAEHAVTYEERVVRVGRIEQRSIVGICTCSAEFHQGFVPNPGARDSARALVEARGGRHLLETAHA